MHVKAPYAPPSLQGMFFSSFLVPSAFCGKIGMVGCLLLPVCVGRRQAERRAGRAVRGICPPACPAGNRQVCLSSSILFPPSSSQQAWIYRQGKMKARQEGGRQRRGKMVKVRVGQ